MKEKPYCQTIYPWLKANLGARSLAPLTGTDDKALSAAVMIIGLYSYHRDDSVIQAFGLVAGKMQPSTQELAYHAIAYVLNWEDRATIWKQAGLPEITNPRRCAYE